MSELEFNLEAEESFSTYFADVILPLPLPGVFTYRIPEALQDFLVVGGRVIVPFGAKKILTGIVSRIHEEVPKRYEAKKILDVLEDKAIISGPQLAFFNWMASYYLCTLGEVIMAALPSGLRLNSESKVQINPLFTDFDTTPFSDTEHLILQTLQSKQSLTYSEIQRITGLKKIYHLIKSLVQKEAILIFEEVKEKFSPAKTKKVRLNPKYLSEQELNALFRQLEKKPAQTDTLLTYLRMNNVLESKALNIGGVGKMEFLAQKSVSVSSFKTLRDKAVFEEFEEIKPRFEFLKESTQTSEKISLSEEQTLARDTILRYFETNSIFLLHGVTGSGKTAIYIDLISDVLENGGQVLYLLPEIALTSQIVKRLAQFFGNDMGIYHSRFSDNERVEVWNGVLAGKVNFVVGVRSALFLPFDNLSLIIADEEHDASFKQHEPAPRYHAVEAAMKLAQLHHAKVLLGSATPSLEAYYLAQGKKYGYHYLAKRFGSVKLPDIEFIDLKKAHSTKSLKGDFSEKLLHEIEETLNSGLQVILFQNRRGYAPNMQCGDCGNILMCGNCSVSLTYHKFKEEMQCHYCGFREKVPAQCTVCKSTKLLLHGFGTEKLEEDLNEFMPQARIQRMDQDTTRGKYRYEKIISDFEQGNVDILVGTQMVTKGLDFERVALVGVLDADRMMYYPDFRALERTFQLLTQVAGRAGRAAFQGKVLIQTWQPGHWILKMVQESNLEGFYTREISDRRKFNYPPFTRILEIIIKHEDRLTSRNAALELNRRLLEKVGQKRVLGPVEPVISKIRNKYIFQILIKLEREKLNLNNAKSRIDNTIKQFRSEKKFRSVLVIVNVDPR